MLGKDTTTTLKQLSGLRSQTTWVRMEFLSSECAPGCFHNCEKCGAQLGTPVPPDGYQSDAELKTRLARLNEIQDTSPGAHQERIFPSRESPTFPTGKARNFHLQQAQGRGHLDQSRPRHSHRRPALQRCLRPVAHRTLTIRTSIRQRASTHPP